MVMVTPIDEIEEWGRRMIRRETDIEFLTTDAEFRAFIWGRIGAEREYRPTPGIERAIPEMRRLIEEGIGVRPRRDPVRPWIIHWYGIAEKRFISKEDALSKAWHWMLERFKFGR